MKKQMTRDEHGYINERGASKYWGVTTSKVDGQRIWVVNFKVAGVTFGYRAKNFTLKEVDAARIAAFLYEKGEETVNSRDRVVYILTADKKYVIKLDLDDTYFYREKAANQKVYQFNPSLTLPFEDEVAKPVVKSLGSVDSYRNVSLQGDTEVTLEISEVSKVLKSLDETGPSERELITFVTDAVLNKSISENSARMMISILERAVY